MADGIPALGLADLRRIVGDPTELDKGVLVFDRGGLAHLARHGRKLYAEASGSGAAPYRVSIAFDHKGEARGRCSCMAARTRPFCKHAAGLLVAWAQAPASFAVAEGPPPGEDEGRVKRRAVKTGKTDAPALMRSGVEQVETMVRDLAATGIASVTGARVDEMRALSGGLRESGLRRLAGRTLELAAIVEPAARRGVIDPARFAEVMCDALLTARKVGKHVDGEPMEARYVEELIGKTWRKRDREPVAGLELMEYAFTVRTTPDDFRIRESRFLDLASGAHYSEKQILPAFLVKRTAAKRSHAGQVLAVGAASVYPGFAPRRIDLEDRQARPLGAADLEAAVARALPDLGAALAAFQQHRRDVFAPDRLPIAVRVDTLLATGSRARWIDAAGDALFLPGGEELTDALGEALRGARLVAVLGDVDLDAALPTLWPLALVVRRAVGLELAPLRQVARGGGAAGAARVEGASPAAVSVAEVRGELADALVAGLAMATRRLVDPLAARLRELGLDRPAALVEALPGHADPSARFDDFVKVYQVLGLALLRLAGTAQVDRSRLVAVPDCESVAVVPPAERLAPRDIARRVAAGELGRFEAAVLHARWYEGIPADQLAAAIYPTWADGAAGPYVARAFAGRGEQAIAAAERALSSGRGRVARMTAVRVLRAVGGARAEAVLAGAAHGEDAGVRGLAGEALEELRVARGAIPPEAAAARRQLEAQTAARLGPVLLDAARWEIRLSAVEELTRAAGRHALPALRAAFAGDPSAAVRQAAALALADLGDTEIVERLVAQLARRREHGAEAAARLAARALGVLGDVRGLDELLAAWAEAWKPGVVAEALRAFGVAALEPMLELLEARPELARRKAALDALRLMPPADLVDTILARLPAHPAAGRLYLRILGTPPLAAEHRRVAAALPRGARS